MAADEVDKFVRAFPVQDDEAIEFCPRSGHCLGPENGSRELRQARAQLGSRSGDAVATLPESLPSRLLPLSLEQHTQLHRYLELD